MQAQTLNELEKPGRREAIAVDARLTAGRPATANRSVRELLDALPNAVYTTDTAGRLTYYNPAAIALAGRQPQLGRDRWCVSHLLYTPSGEPLPHDHSSLAHMLQHGETEERGVEAVMQRPDGTFVPFIAYPKLLHDDAGRVVGAMNTLVEIAERKEAEARHKTLLAEVNHRVKNTLAAVQALAQGTLRDGGVAADVRAAFEARLLALSSVHNQLARESWRAADLRLALQDIVGPYGGSAKLKLSGPEVRLPPKVALALAMVLHELAANAAQYGALSVSDGRIDIAWSVEAGEEGNQLKLKWRESGGPAVAATDRRGFGRRVLERAVGRELGGTARLDFAREGLRCSIDVPLPVGRG